MPILFIIGLILAAIAILAGVTARLLRKRQDADAHLVRWFTWAAAILAGLLVISSCLTVVGTRRIGVVTEFGRPVDSLSNGLHAKVPWQKVNELDGSIQTDSHVGEECTDIRIGNESAACVDNTVRWRIITNEADLLFRDFRNMDNIRESLVTRELNAALNEILGDFNPLDAVNLDDSGHLASLDDLANAVSESLRERVQGRIEVLSVTIPLIRYDEGTQGRLNEYQEEIANTRIAEQREQTAQAQARANEALSASVSNNPNVIVARCMEVLAQMVDKEQPVPAGFSCWPGGGTGVVIPSSTPIG